MTQATEEPRTHAEDLETANGFQTNPRLMAIEAVMFAVIAVLGAAITYPLVRFESETPAPLRVSKMIEAEMLPIVQKSGDFGVLPQDTSTFTGGRWSENRQLFVAARSRGDALTLGLPPTKPGSYQLILYMTRSYDYGIVQVSVNGGAVGSPVDLWVWGVEATGPLTMGTVMLDGKSDVIRFEVVGRNDRTAAPFYQFGIDGLVLQPEP